MDHCSQVPVILKVLIGIVFSRGAAAICAGWEQVSTAVDDGSSFSNFYSQRVDYKVCPSNSKEPCEFDRKSYDIMVERILASNAETLSLPDGEADAIFKLAQDGYNKKMNSQNMTDRTTNFISRNASVSTQSTKILHNGSITLEIEPGQEKTLVWIPFYMHSTGTLSGCSNETLNNKTITAAAPYLTQEPRLNNQTVLAGSWGSFSTDVPDDDGRGSKATSLVEALINSVIWGLVTTTIVVVLL